MRVLGWLKRMVLALDEALGSESPAALVDEFD